VCELLQAKGAKTSEGLKRSPSVEELRRRHSIDSFSSGSHVSFVDHADHPEILCKAAAKANLDQVSELLAAGVDVDAMNCDDRRALHLASEGGHLKVVRLLVEHKADVHARDRWGQTPLKGAEVNSHFDVAAFLRDCGAQSDPFDECTKNVEEYSRDALRWWESRLCKEAALPPTSIVLPITALQNVLQGDYGFDLSQHEVLHKELQDLVLSAENRRKAFFGVLQDGLEMVAKEDFLNAVLMDLPGYRPLGHKPKIADSGNLGHNVLSYIVLGKLAIGNWSSFVQVVKSVFEEVLADESLANDGEPAQYIPQLRDGPTGRLAVAICTVDGQTCAFGDYEEHFSIQSTGKALAYTLAMKQHSRSHKEDYVGPEGARYVHTYVGQEPSGRAFNDFTLTPPDENGIAHPFNPVTNAGAIVTCSMIDEDKFDDTDRALRMESRMSTYKAFISELSGGMEVGDCLDVFESERSEAFNNYALANFMRARGTFPPHVKNHEDLTEVVDFYLRVCSTRVNTKMLAAVGSTFAKFGANPFTGKSLMTPSESKQTLQILLSCGMYDFSGEWACTVGLPAKSGVSGNVFIVVPGMMGMCVWSPKLDGHGNSVRGVRMAQLLK
jgi:glutaminase